MTFDEVDRLLDPSPLPLETGYERLADGVLHVAARTDLHDLPSLSIAENRAQIPVALPW